MYHVSNLHLDLGPVVGNIAASLKLAARRFNDEEFDDESNTSYGRDASDWIVVAGSENDLAVIKKDARWKALSSFSGKGIWTDDYSDLLGVLIH